MTDQRTTDRVTPFELKRSGGAHLGAARSFLQRRVIGGDRLTWGSGEEVKGLCVLDIEEMAAEIAAAAINDDRKYRRDVKVRS